MGELLSSAGGVGRDEDGLLGESINYHKNSVKTRRVWKEFDEVHGNGFPRMGRNRELLKGAVELVKLGFGSHTSHARLDVIPYKPMESQPVILSVD